MRILTVIPINRGTLKDTLTYFSAREVSVGSVLLVPLRNKNVPALVTDSRDALVQKAALKAASFSLKRAGQLVGKKPFSDSFLLAAGRTADFHATVLGAVLYATIPEPLAKKILHRTASECAPLRHGRYVIQASDEDRATQYRSLVRESFQEKKSVFLLVPTVQDAERMGNTLAKGIDDYLLVLHSDLTKKQLEKAFAKIKERTHPLLLIATPGFLSLLDDTTGTLILEREHAAAYKQIARPFLNFRVLAKELAWATGVRFVVGDCLLSSETYLAYTEGIYEPLVALRSHLRYSTVRLLVDTKSVKPDMRGRFNVISNELRNLIEEMRKASERVFVFVARKGLAPSTVCGDCGTLLVCDQCSAPLVLHKTSGEKRFYLCHRCTSTYEASLRCKHCTSWKLVPLGIGSELVVEQLAELFPKSTLLRLDAEVIKSRADALHVIHLFHQTPGSILVGTEQALPYLTRNIGASAIASLDSLLSLPDFQVNERIMYILTKLTDLSERTVLLQTRAPDHPLIRAVCEGNLTLFYQEELGMRKTLQFPPYTVLVKITRVGKLAVIESYMDELKKKLTPYNISIHTTFTKKTLGIGRLSIILKIPRNEWPHKQVLSVLSSLPPSVSIDVNPLSLW